MRRTAPAVRSIAPLTEAAMAVALSVLLGNVRLVELPNGGSIALATLPLIAVAIARGPRLGVTAGACSGIAHALSGGTIVHPAQLGLDYLLAYAALGFAGIGAGRGISRSSMAPGIVLAMSCHLAAMVVSGIIFFSAVASSAALEYALAYNAATVIPETILALWLTPPLVRALARANPADAWRRGLLAPPRLTPRSARQHVTTDNHPALTDTRTGSTDTMPARTLSGAQPGVMRRPCDPVSPRPTLTRRPPPGIARPAPFSTRWAGAPR